MKTFRCLYGILDDRVVDGEGARHIFLPCQWRKRKALAKYNSLPWGNSAELLVNLTEQVVLLYPGNKIRRVVKPLLPLLGFKHSDAWLVAPYVVHHTVLLPGIDVPNDEATKSCEFLAKKIFDGLDFCIYLFRNVVLAYQLVGRGDRAEALFDTLAYPSVIRELGRPMQVEWELNSPIGGDEATQ